MPLGKINFLPRLSAPRPCRSGLPVGAASLDFQAFFGQIKKTWEETRVNDGRACADSAAACGSGLRPCTLRGERAVHRSPRTGRAAISAADQEPTRFNGGSPPLEGKGTTPKLASESTRRVLHVRAESSVAALLSNRKHTYMYYNIHI